MKNCEREGKEENMPLYRFLLKSHGDYGKNYFFDK